MKYNYRHLYSVEIESKFQHTIELPTYAKLKSILVETNLPKRTIMKLIKDHTETLLEIPIFYLKNLWFPLDFETRTCKSLTLKVENNTNKERYIRVYLAQEES